MSDRQTYLDAAKSVGAVRAALTLCTMPGAISRGYFFESVEDRARAAIETLRLLLRCRPGAFEPGDAKRGKVARWIPPADPESAECAAALAEASRVLVLLADGQRVAGADEVLRAAEKMARAFGGDDADATPNGRRKLPSGNDGDYRPATWFRKGMADRLRQAASKKRKTKRVATRTVDGVVCYSVADARRWWPYDVPKEA